MKSEITDVDELIASMVPPGARGHDPKRLRRAIVTGGDTGIGRYTALAMAHDGCDVAFTYNEHREDAEITAEAIRKLGRKPFIQQMNLEQPEHAEPAVDQMVDALGGSLDIFVNNAGTMTMGKLPNIDLAEMERLFRINTFGAVLGCQRALRHMLDIDPDGDDSVVDQAARLAGKVLAGRIATPRKTPGRIIIITSTHEHVPSPADTLYTMTKHALGGFIKCAAFETAGTNVTVNGIRPGEIATPMNNMGPEDAMGQNRPHVPAQRVGHPSEIAEAVRYLASDNTSFTTGVSYDVGGGLAVAQPMAMANYRKMV